MQSCSGLLVDVSLPLPIPPPPLLVDETDVSSHLPVVKRFVVLFCVSFVSALFCLGSVIIIIIVKVAAALVCPRELLHSSHVSDRVNTS